MLRDVMQVVAVLGLLGILLMLAFAATKQNEALARMRGKTPEPPRTSGEGRYAYHRRRNALSRAHLASFLFFGLFLLAIAVVASTAGLLAGVLAALILPQVALLLLLVRKRRQSDGGVV
jgi:hypothetical protein